MNVIAQDYVFIGMDKTGSSSLRRLVRRIQGDDWVRFPEEQTDQLPGHGRNLPVIGSTRNPFTWYPSYWTWYREERFQDAWRGINPSISFPDWVRNYKDRMVVEFNRLYEPGVKIVRMEHQAEDLIRILEEIRGPLPKQTLDIIHTAEVANRNPNVKPECIDELRELILEGAFPIFENYYPEEV